MRCAWYRIGTESPPAGAVLRRDVVVSGDSRQQFRRGTPLVEVLARGTLPPDMPLPIALPTGDDLEQHAASRLLAEQVAGPDIRLDPPHQGQVNLRAAAFGVVRVDQDALARLNRSGRALVATVLDGRVADEGEVVAIAKAPALFVPEGSLRRVLASVSTPVIRLARFRIRRVGLLVGERVRRQAVDVAVRALGQKLARFAAQLETVEQLARDDVADIVRRLSAWREQGIEFILTAGSIMLDPQDPFLRAVERVGARMALRGAPVDPGTMFWIAYWDGSPIFGLASCEMYGRTSVFDLALPYALAGERLDRATFARLAHGGLLLDTQVARVPQHWRRASQAEE